MNIFMKKIILFAFVAFVLAGFSASVALAAIPQDPSGPGGAGWTTFNTDPQDKPTLRVSNYTQNPGCSSCWSSSTSGVNPGDVVSFVFYYHNTGSVTAKSSFAEISFSNNGSSITAHGEIGAQNASSVSGSATVYAASGKTIRISSGTKYYGLGDVLPGWDNQGYLVVQFTVEGEGTAPSLKPTATLSANKNTVQKGESVTLSWTSQNATECHALAGAGFETGSATSGSDPVSPLNGTTTFSMECTGPGGSVQVNKTVTVETSQYPVPTVTINANPTSVNSGGTSVITWSSTNATQCYATSGAGFATNNATSGSDQSDPLYNTTTFSVTCTGSGGSNSASVTVYVNSQPQDPVPTVSLTANPSSVTSGGSSVLTWSSTNATQCYGTGGSGFSVNAISGSDQVGPLYYSTTFSVTCTGPGGSNSASATVYVNSQPQDPVPTVTINANPTSVNSGGTSVITWSSTNATQCYATSGAGFATNNATSGSDQSDPLYNTTTFSVTCTGSGGSNSASVTVSVNSNPPQQCQVPTVITNSATGVSSSSATLNASVNPNNCSTSYWFEYGTTMSLGNTTASQSAGSSSGSLVVSSGISGLLANTTYYFRAVSQNTAGTVQGSILSFTTGGGGGTQGTAPTALTNPATNVSQTTATLNGQINPNSAATSYWFEYGTTMSLGNTTAAQSAGSSASFMSVSGSVSSLSANTTYFFRIVAQNQYGTTQGTILQFTTGGGGTNNGLAPYAVTYSATNYSQNWATLNGQVNPNGSQTSYWFEYGPTSSFGNSTAFQNIGSGSSANNVTASISGLQQNQTYYFRIIAQNQYGISYGSTLSFSTGGDNNESLYVQTNSASNTTQNSATLNGYVSSSNTYTTYAWFEYGTNANYLSYTTNSRYIGGSSQSFSDSIFNLSPNTTYYYRAVARGDYGTQYGNTVSFSTGSGYYGGQQPTVVTESATIVTRNSGLLNGSVNPNGGLTSAWFEYGPTTALGTRTIIQPMGSSYGSLDMAAAVSGLLPNTPYYFRAVAQNQSGTVYGSILSFVTQGITIVQPPIIIGPPTVIRTGGEGLSCVLVVPSLNVSALLPGEEFVLTVTYKNGCSYNLNNAFLKVILPTEVDFISTNYPFFNRDANGISYNLGAVATGFQSAISIQGRVRNSVNVGDTLIYSAVLNFNDDDGEFHSISAYLTAVVGAGKTLTASIFDAFRDLLGNWLFDLLLILLILFLIWWIFFRRDEEEERVDVLRDDTQSHPQF